MTLRWRAGFTVGYTAVFAIQGLCIYTSIRTGQPWFIPLVAFSAGATIRDLYRLWKPRKANP